MNKIYDRHEEDVNSFYEAVKATRIEGTGVSIKEIAKIFRDYFDDAELSALIRELTNPLT